VTWRIGKYALVRWRRGPSIWSFAWRVSDYSYGPTWTHLYLGRLYIAVYSGLSADERRRRALQRSAKAWEARSRQSANNVRD